jgi:hypothetical protein
LAVVACWAVEKLMNPIIITAPRINFFIVLKFKCLETGYSINELQMYCHNNEDACA